MNTPKPSALTKIETAEEFEAGQKAIFNFATSVKESPKPTSRPRTNSAPVRNPAFREHEGLRNLQKQLNSRSTPRKNK